MKSWIWLQELQSSEEAVEIPVATLSRDGDGRVFTGPGSLHRTAEGALRLKMYAAADVADADDLMDTEPGQLIRDDQLFSITLTTMDGRKWTGHKAWPNVSVSAATGMAVISADVNKLEAGPEITFENRKAGASTIVLAFKNDTKFPTNVVEKIEKKRGDDVVSRSTTHSGAEVVLRDCRLRLYRDDDLLFAKLAGSMTEDRDRLGHLLTSALQFVFGQRLAAEFCLYSNASGITQVMRSFDQQRLKSPTPRPFDWSGTPSRTDVWELFRAYFEFLKHEERERADELTRWVAEVIEAGNVTVEIRSLVVAVAVEGIVRLLQASEPDDHLSAGLDAVLKLIREAPSLDKGLVKRLEGTIAAMRRPRAVDYLRQLAEANELPSEYVQAWSAMRNSTAHAANMDLGSVDRAIGDLHRATALFYRLVFRLIDYRGPYTDYGKPGWPTGSPSG